MSLEVLPIYNHSAQLPAKRGGVIAATSSQPVRHMHLPRHTGIILASLAFSFFSPGLGFSQPSTDVLPAPAVLPDAPDPQTPAASPPPKLKPCPSPSSSPARPPETGAKSAIAQGGRQPDTGPCKVTWANRYEKFVNGPQAKPLTPKDKAWLAARNVADPFNSITILGDAAIAIGSNSHSVYGPGMAGYGRYVGVSYSQDMIGEFFGTFLIPSIAHQDPHYL